MSNYAVGIEEEYQLVDPETGALHGRWPERLADEGAARAESQHTIDEVDTPVSATVADAVGQLARRRTTAAGIAAPRGLTIAASGLHPVGPRTLERASAASPNRRSAFPGGLPTSLVPVFDMQIRIAVPSRQAAVRAMLGAATFVPHLIALAASSPFHRGEDTGYASYRTVLRDTRPRSGLPRAVASVAEYDELVRILGGLRGRSPLSWDVRPSATLPALEFCFMDVSPSLDMVALLAALARALTAMFADRPVPAPTAIEQQLLCDNRWRAARFGLGAEFFELTPVTGRERGAGVAIQRLVRRLEPVAERLGDAEALRSIEWALRRPSAADLMRRVYEEEGSFSAVTRWVLGEMRQRRAGDAISTG